MGQRFRYIVRQKPTSTKIFHRHFHRRVFDFHHHRVIVLDQQVQLAMGQSGVDPWVSNKGGHDKKGSPPPTLMGHPSVVVRTPLYIHVHHQQGCAAWGLGPAQGPQKL